MRYKLGSLPPKLVNIIEHKATEYPFTGIYNAYSKPGTYLCRKCGIALYRADAKFASSCGWPSFEFEIKDVVRQEKDSDGSRTEILCNRCNAHLGHVFYGEKLTPMNTRHCVNSASLDFVENDHVIDSEEAIIAAGCFWGVEYYYQKLPGVLKVESGYIGGLKDNPGYNEICSGNTGHLEGIRILFDFSKINYEEIIKYFFEIHDFSQTNGQGLDIGSQYLSACFYYDVIQKNIIESVISQLTVLGFKVATQVRKVTTFWPAEGYHQNYYNNNSGQPYCHRHTKIF